MVGFPGYMHGTRCIFVFRHNNRDPHFYVHLNRQIKNSKINGVYKRSLIKIFRGLYRLYVPTYQQPCSWKLIEYCKGNIKPISRPLPNVIYDMNKHCILHYVLSFMSCHSLPWGINRPVNAGVSCPVSFNRRTWSKSSVASLLSEGACFRILRELFHGRSHIYLLNNLFSTLQDKTFWDHTYNKEYYILDKKFKQRKRAFMKLPTAS
jgi:hypothetical protein